MKSIGTAAAAALLLWCAAAGTAGEPIGAPHDFAADGKAVAAPNDFAAGTAPTVAAPEGAFPAGPGCASCGCNSHHNDCWAWLCYRPLHLTRCGECSACCGRWVPLYLYFLGHCQEHPCTGCGVPGGCCNCWSGHAWSGAATGVGFVSH